MGRYIHGWIECKIRHPDFSEPPWYAVIDIEHLLDHIKDYYGYYSIFGDGETIWGTGEQHSGVLKYFHPIAPGRGLPDDVSPEVQADYAILDEEPTPKEKANCDVVTCTPHNWLCWREIKQADWDRHADAIHQFESNSYLGGYQENEQGEPVFRYITRIITRPAVSWLSWLEIKQIDWEEEASWLEIHECLRNDQRKIFRERTYLYSPDLSLPEFEEKVGFEQLNISKEQEWDFGEEVWKEYETFFHAARVYRTVKVKMKRKDLIPNWERIFKVMALLAEKHGDDGVRVISWIY